MTNEQKEYLREALLTFTANRHAQSFTVTALTNFVRRDQLVDFTIVESEVREALAVLEGFGLVRQIPSDLGGSVRWIATSEGVIRHERAQG